MVKLVSNSIENDYRLWDVEQLPHHIVRIISDFAFPGLSLVELNLNSFFYFCKASRAQRRKLKSVAKP